MVACHAELWAGPEMQGTEAVLRLVVATRGAVRKQADGVRSKQAWLLKLVPASLRSCVKQAGGERGKQAWLLVSGVLVQPS